MKKRMIQLLAGCLIAGTAGYFAPANVGASPNRVNIKVRGWPCAEDEVLRGYRTGAQYNGTKYSYYKCWNPGW